MESDTNVWVYGSGVMEGVWLLEKQVYIESVVGREYIHINKLCDCALQHPTLCWLFMFSLEVIRLVLF